MTPGEEEDPQTFRTFVDLPGSSSTPNGHDQKKKDLSWIRDNIVGSDASFQTPFGRTTPLIYADWTASSRAFKPLESYIQKYVYPNYANTHTSTSITGLQSTCYRSEARQIIQQAVNGNTKKDVVLFTGSGSTSAVSKLIHVLGLNISLPPQETNRPVVFIGPFEHHSNILPWRESVADTITIPENVDGTGIDIEQLKLALIKYKDRPLRIGAFSAASNVTGIRENVNQISSLLHRHGALACWDYACAGPYTTIDMNPVLPGDDPDRAFVHKDAVFLSPHKFVGGVNTPGLLIAKKCLFQNAVPADGSAGGGTVYFVKEDGHRYLSNRVEREEGGTPDVIGAIRAGLTFRIKTCIELSKIEEMDVKWAAKIESKLGKHPRIELLGPSWGDESIKRLPIVSFLIRHEKLFLHYNFVSALLNDVFGIQTRGGCMCAGPYAQKLLGMSQETINAIENELVQDPKHCEYLRPGFTRFSLAYFITEEEVDYILDAVCMIADYGYKLLPLYRFNTRTGEWKHHTRFTKFPERLWLEDAFCGNDNENGEEPVPKQALNTPSFSDLLASGRDILNNTPCKESLGDQRLLFSDTAAPLRWFVLPSEALQVVKKELTPSVVVSSENPINPQVYWKNILREQTSSHTEPYCVDGSCFKPRKEKFPLRTAEVIRQESFSGTLVAGSSATGAPTSQSHDEIKLRPKPPKNIIRNVGKAIAEWEMIEEGDRLLLGLSGGKDSLCLLHVLLYFQKKAPINFEIAACTIDPITDSFDPSPLIPYMKDLGVTYHYERVPIFDQAKVSLQGTSICSFCARMKRGALYAVARKHKYNKLVVAQHLDDLVETTMMGLFHNGNLRSMMANYEEKGGDIRVIRPLVYVRESETKEFSYSAKLPVINENCPACFEAPQERKRVKKLLAKEEAMYPKIFFNMRRSLIPLMDPELLDEIDSVRAKRDQLGRKRTQQQKQRK